MPICNRGLCNCLTKSGRHSCYQNNHILQPLKNDCESRAQIYKNSMMISGTTIVWCGTQDSTIMDGRHTSGIFTVQTKFPPMLQLPVRAIIAICLRHILPSARESRSTVRPWLSWRISAQLVWRLDWTYMRDFIMPSICSSCSLSILPHLPSVLSAPSRPGPSSCSLPSTPRRTRRPFP